MSHIPGSLPSYSFAAPMQSQPVAKTNSIDQLAANVLKRICADRNEEYIKISEKPVSLTRVRLLDLQQHPDLARLYLKHENNYARRHDEERYKLIKAVELEEKLKITNTAVVEKDAARKSNPDLSSK
jgi:hypothetical protein